MKSMDLFKSAYAKTAFNTQLDSLFNNFAGHRHCNHSEINVEAVATVEKIGDDSSQKVDNIQSWPACFLPFQFLSNPRNEGLFDLPTSWGGLAWLHTTAIDKWKEPGNHKIAIKTLSVVLWVVALPLLLTKYLLALACTMLVGFAFQVTHGVQSLFSRKEQPLNQEVQPVAACSPAL